MDSEKIDALLLERDELKEHCRRLQDSVSKLGFPPGHFYSPVVDTDDPFVVSAVTNRTGRPAPAGIDLDLDAMKQLMQRFVAHYRLWPFSAEKNATHRFHYENPFFGPFDAVIYFSMLLEFRPRRVIEVGCGYSSRVLLDTRDLFLQDRGMEITLIDPNMERVIAAGGLPAASNVNSIERRLQDVNINLFDSLEENDILFIDSSHISKTGSDVNHYVFEILPRLKRGVLIHIHDILYSFDYPAEWVLQERRSWNEVYLIRAFLEFNKVFRVLMWNNCFYHCAGEVLRQLMPLCAVNEGGSLWLKKLE
jgi:predicted O-methyltransferase YrrM